MAKSSPAPLIAMTLLCVVGMASSFMPEFSDSAATQPELVAESVPSQKSDMAPVRPLPPEVPTPVAGPEGAPPPAASSPAVPAAARSSSGQIASEPEPASPVPMSPVGAMLAVRHLIEPSPPAPPVKAPVAPAQKPRTKDPAPHGKIEPKPVPVPAEPAVSPKAAVSNPVSETSPALRVATAEKILPSPKVAAAPATKPATAEIAKPEPSKVPAEYAVVGFDANRVWLKVDATRTLMIQRGESIPGLGQFKGADTSGAQFEAGKVTRHVDVQPIN